MQHLEALTGFVYSVYTLVNVALRSQGIIKPDPNHTPGENINLPARFLVNKEYHDSHHNQDPNAYFSGVITLLDQILGTALSFKGKKIAVTGGSGTFASELFKYLELAGAKTLSVTSRKSNSQVLDNTRKTIKWKIGEEEELINTLINEGVEILVLNHGVNFHSNRSSQAVLDSYEINTFSTWRLLDLFSKSVQKQDLPRMEVWVNLSQSEVLPAFSPLYEESKRSLGKLVTLKRLDNNCVIRKLILGPFKSELNPKGFMSSALVAQQVVKLAQKGHRNIIVTSNPLVPILHTLKEWSVSQYYRRYTDKA